MGRYDLYVEEVSQAATITNPCNSITYHREKKRCQSVLFVDGDGDVDVLFQSVDGIQANFNLNLNGEMILKCLIMSHRISNCVIDYDIKIEAIFGYNSFSSKIIFQFSSQ